MEYALNSARPILERTPAVLNQLLRDLPDQWITGNEGPDSWSPFDVVGHLVHCDHADWMPRVMHILNHGDSAPFVPLDRFAQAETSKGKTLPQLLDEFSAARADSLNRLDALKLSDADLKRPGRHPTFGAVTLGQLLSTWVAHDLDHIVQIARCMGRQYSEAVGPWREYLRIIKTPVN